MMNAADMTIDEFKAELKRIKDAVSYFWKEGVYTPNRNRIPINRQGLMALRTVRRRARWS